MKVLVLGASGFIAGFLIRRLLSMSGVEVIAGVRDPSRGPVGPKITIRRLEATDAASIVEAVAGATHVVNCVMGKPVAMAASTRTVLAAADARRIPVVHMSSVAVYQARFGTVCEESPLAPDDWYGRAKVKCETMVRAAADSGTPVICLRPALVYGPGSVLWSDRIARLLRAGRLGDLGAAGDGYCNLIHVEDVVTAIVSALARPDLAGQAFNLADPVPPTWNKYLAWFAKSLGVELVPRIPDWQMALERKLAAPALRIGEIIGGQIGMAERVPPPITPGLHRLFGLRVRYDTGRADPLFGGSRIAWQDGVQGVARALVMDRRSR